MSLSQTMTKPNRQVLVVRKYTEADIPIIRGKVMVEVPKLPHYEGVKVDARRIDQLMYDGLRHEDRFMARVLVTPDNTIVGGICGYCVTQLLSYDKMTGDIFLFIDPEWRSLPNALKLMLAYRDWGIAQGATIVAATQTSGYKEEVLGKLLQRYGDYEPVGTIYYHKPRNPDVAAMMGVRQ